MSMQYAVSIFIVLISLSGCSNHVKVVGDYPSPLVTALPISAGVVIDSDFRTYTFQEESDDRWSRSIELGESQTQLLRSVLPSVFSKLTEQNALPSFPNDGPQLWLYPSIQDLQYATPRETRLKLFEVWIKYGIKAYDDDGQLLADWIVTAYGKTPSAFMKSEEEALNAALVVALRDLGANLSLHTRQIPEIRNWLQEIDIGEAP